MDLQLRANIVRDARSWEGVEFAPGESAQCANFVRHVFSRRGYDLPSAAKPDDLYLWPWMPLSPSYANSFAGDEVGVRIARKDVKAGDLVMFRDTYNDGTFPAGIITHVGIATGPNTMVDRSTSAHPIHERGIDETFPGKFFEARRPHRFVGPQARTLKFDMHDGKRGLLIDKKDIDAPVVFAFDGKLPESLTINGRKRKLVACHVEMKFVDE